MMIIFGILAVVVAIVNFTVEQEKPSERPLAAEEVEFHF